MSPLLAHRVNSRQRSTSVAFGAKRTLRAALIERGFMSILSRPRRDIVVSYGTSICDTTEKEEEGACCGRGPADRPASRARSACARRSVGGLTEGPSLAPRSRPPAGRAGACDRPAGRSAHQEGCASGGNGKSRNRPLG